MGIIGAINQRAQVNNQRDQIEEEKKRREQEAAIKSLETILSMGGSFSGEQLDQVAQGTGMNSGVLKSIMEGKVAEHIANSPEEVKTGTAINERKPISEVEYENRFGSGGKDVIYTLPSAEARIANAEVAKQKALSPITVDTAGKVAKATSEGTALGEGTPQALQAKEDVQKVLMTYQTQLNDLQQKREIAVKQAMPDKNTIDKLDEDIRHNKAMESYYENLLGFKETTTPAGGNIDAVLDAAVSANLAGIDPKTKAIVLKPVGIGSAEELSLKLLAKNAGLELTAQPAKGPASFVKEALGKPQIQYGFTAPTVKGGSGTSKSVVKKEKTRGSQTPVMTPAQTAAQNRILGSTEYKAWETRFLQMNPSASEEDARQYYLTNKANK